jgi:hypothetical protein
VRRLAARQRAAPSTATPCCRRRASKACRSRPRADFGAAPQPFAWYRFNVTQCGDERLVRFLARMKNP